MTSSAKPKSRIRTEREKRGLAQAALANLCGDGIKAADISLIERGALKRRD